MADRGNFAKPPNDPPLMISRQGGLRPPGSPDDGAIPRLPVVPPGGAHPFAGAPTPALLHNQQAPLRGQALTYEAQSSQVTIGVGETGVMAETTIYTTRQRWRAIDVYFDPTTIQSPFSFEPAFFSVFIYAVGQASKTLVASGRFGALIAADFPTGYTDPIYIAGARANVERYEVTVQYSELPSVGGRLVGVVAFTTIASDEATDLADDIGLTKISQFAVPSLITRRLGGAQTFIGRPELREVWAVNNSAAPRYLLLLEGVGIPAAGDVPTIVWGLGPGAGYGVHDTTIRYRSEEGFALAASSTATTYTPVADCMIQAVVK